MILNLLLFSFPQNVPLDSPNPLRAKVSDEFLPSLLGTYIPGYKPSPARPKKGGALFDVLVQKLGQYCTLTNWDSRCRKLCGLIGDYRKRERDGFSVRKQERDFCFHTFRYSTTTFENFDIVLNSITFLHIHTCTDKFAKTRTCFSFLVAKKWQKWK